MAGPLSIIYQRSWEAGEVIPISKRSMKEDRGIYRPVTLTSVPEKKYEKDYIRFCLKAFKEQ